MARQYKIFYRRGTDENYRTLEIGAHAALYDRTEVNNAVHWLRANPHVEGIAIRLNDEQYNLIVFEQEAIAPRSFILTR